MRFAGSCQIATTSVPPLTGPPAGAAADAAALGAPDAPDGVGALHAVTTIMRAAAITAAKRSLSGCIPVLLHDARRGRDPILPFPRSSMGSRTRSSMGEPDEPKAAPG